MKAADGVYHMFVAEMSEHCGLFSWTSQSRIVRATSPTPGGRKHTSNVTSNLPLLVSVWLYFGRSLVIAAHGPSLILSHRLLVSLQATPSLR